MTSRAKNPNLRFSFLEKQILHRIFEAQCSLDVQIGWCFSPWSDLLPLAKLTLGFLRIPFLHRKMSVIHSPLSTKARLQTFWFWTYDFWNVRRWRTFGFLKLGCELLWIGQSPVLIYLGILTVGSGTGSASPRADFVFLKLFIGNRFSWNLGLNPDLSTLRKTRGTVCFLGCPWRAALLG